MRLATYAHREIVLLTAFWVVVAAAAWRMHPLAVAVPAAAWVAFLAFFRDPRRVPPEGEHLLVAPADGRVVDVREVDHEPLLGGPAIQIGIFLSIFDVHVNRAPCGARVLKTEYRPGRFHDARAPECAAQNESMTTLLERPDGLRVAVRQVAGKVARRIVLALRPGDEVVRGGPIGMIKFGSRVELWVPRAAIVQVHVRAGDRVRAGESVLVAVEPAMAAVRGG